jgi:hypothetical protein
MYKNRYFYVYNAKFAKLVKFAKFAQYLPNLLSGSHKFKDKKAFCEFELSHKLQQYGKYSHLLNSQANGHCLKKKVMSAKDEIFSHFY